MASVTLYRMDGADAGPIELNDAVFGVEMKKVVVKEAVTALMNAKRQGNAATKTRGDVRGGGAKPFKQKGTGRARQGSSREPQMKGGGTVFGPHPRSYRQQVPVAIKRQALCCMLSDRTRKGMLNVLESLRCEAPKTKPFAALVNRLNPGGKKMLFITAGVDRNAMLSARNISHVTLTTANDVNALDVLNASRVLMAKDAVALLEARLSGARSAREGVA